MRDAPSSNLGLFDPQIIVPGLFHKILTFDRVITQRVGQLLGHDAGLRVGAVVGQPGDGDRGLGLPGHGTATLLLVVRRRAVFSDEAPGRRHVALVAARDGCPSSEVVQRAANASATRLAANLEAYNPLVRAADCRDFWRGTSTALGFGRRPMTVGPAVPC